MQYPTGNTHPTGPPSNPTLPAEEVIREVTPESDQQVQYPSTNDRAGLRVDLERFLITRNSMLYQR